MNIYQELEEGFLKEAAANGADVEFLKGMIKEAGEVQQKWAELFDEIEAVEPGFKVKLAGDIYAALNDANVKVALDEAPAGEDQPFMTQVNSWLTHPKLMEFLRGLSPGGKDEQFGGGLAGGVGGGLIGLLLGALAGRPGLGLALGGLGGAGLGAGLMSNASKDWFKGQSDKALGNQRLASGDASFEAQTQNPDLPDFSKQPSAPPVTPQPPTTGPAPVKTDAELVPMPWENKPVVPKPASFPSGAPVVKTSAELLGPAIKQPTLQLAKPSDLEGHGKMNTSSPQTSSLSA